jgi:hypothetical protein
MKKLHLSTDCHGGFVKQNLGKSPDQEMEKYDHDPLKVTGHSRPLLSSEGKIGFHGTVGELRRPHPWR